MPFGISARKDKSCGSFSRGRASSTSASASTSTSSSSGGKCGEDKVSAKKAEEIIARQRALSKMIQSGGSGAAAPAKPSSASAAAPSKSLSSSSSLSLPSAKPRKRQQTLPSLCALQAIKGAQQKQRETQRASRARKPTSEFLSGVKRGAAAEASAASSSSSSSPPALSLRSRLRPLIQKPPPVTLDLTGGDADSAAADDDEDEANGKDDGDYSEEGPHSDESDDDLPLADLAGPHPTPPRAHLSGTSSLLSSAHSGSRTAPKPGAAAAAAPQPSEQTLHRPPPPTKHLRPNRRGAAASRERLAQPKHSSRKASASKEDDEEGGGGGLMASLLRKKILAKPPAAAAATREAAGARGHGHPHCADQDSHGLLDMGKQLDVEEYFQNLRRWDFWKDYDAMHGPQSRPSKSAQNSRQQQQQQQQQQQPKGEKRKHDHNHHLTPPISDHTKQIPNTFRNRSHYQKTWAPLCLQEARAQILSDASMEWRHARRNTLQSQVVATIHSNDLYDTAKDSMVIVIRPLNMEHNRKLNFSTNDVVAFASQESTFNLAFNGRLFKQRHHKHNQQHTPMDNHHSEQLFGFVGHAEYPRRTLDGLRVHVSRRQWREVSSGEKEERLFLWKLGGNVTAMRQFTALSRVGSLPLLSHLLLPPTAKNNDKHDQHHATNESPSTTASTSTTTSTSTNTTATVAKKEHNTKMELLQTMGGKSAVGKGFAAYAMNKFNSSQFAAISAASTEYGKGGFTLVKGPPGTGKTTTLVALLNALHIRQFNLYYDKLRKIASDTSITSTGAKKASLANAAKNKPRILVCAPSNNAVDHILRKIMDDGFIDGNGARYNPSVIRVGVGTNEGVKNVSLESNVNELLEEAKDAAKLDQAIAGYKTELSRIYADINKLRPRLRAISQASPWPLCKDWEIRCDVAFDQTGKVYFVNHKEKVTTYECPPPPEPGETQFHANAMPEYRTFVAQLVKLIERYNKMTSKLARYSIVGKVSGKVSNQVFDSVRQDLETHILDSTHIVMTTLGTAGNQALESTSKFEVVVVDEAAQSVEPATLAALQLGSSHAILVGDPQQLPATIFSVSGRNTKYDRSLFQRLEEAGHEIHLLDTQYRMIPAISNFPRRIFYDSKLKDGSNVEHADYGNPLRNIVFSKFPAFHSFTVFDLDSREERGGTSLSNSTEARFALHLYKSLANNTDHAATKSRIAIITPYSQQVGLLRRTFGKELGSNYDKAVEVNTVDAFQGREANIVVFSCVRAAGSSGIGFLSDVRRMNVALTRSKFFLFVIARCDSIIVNPYWKQLVHHARDANSVIRVPVGGRYQDHFPDLRHLKATPSGSKKRRASLAEKNIREVGEIS